MVKKSKRLVRSRARDDALPRIREGARFEEKRPRGVELAFRQRPIGKRVLAIATKNRKEKTPRGV